MENNNLEKDLQNIPVNVHEKTIDPVDHPDVENEEKEDEEESLIDPDDIANDLDMESDQEYEDEERNEKGFEDDISGADLDIPGSELDDEDEETGNEDEENNHYSIGGDNHDDLEEDNN